MKIWNFRGLAEVQPDLLGLEISKGELRHLTGVDPDQVFRPAIIQNREKRFSFLFNEIFICFVLTAIIGGVVYTIILITGIGSTINLAIALLILVAVTVVISRWLWRKIAYPKMLRNILKKVDKYHALIKTIDINEQLEIDKTAEKSLIDKTLVIQALQLTREDLVHALRAERSLRDHKNLITMPDPFTNNLEALRAIQVNIQANEPGHILNQALQIDISVQEEMRKLQGRRSS